MRSTLTTFDGYPRDDIDIAQGMTVIFPAADYTRIYTGGDNY